MNIIVGEKIKELRIAKNLTQSELAERVGVTTSAISSYEVCARQPSYDILLKMANLFNVSSDYLLGFSRKDLIDVSDLTNSQRNNVQNLILTYKKLNQLLISSFEIDIGMEKTSVVSEIEQYLNNNFEEFQKMLQQTKKN